MRPRAEAAHPHRRRSKRIVDSSVDTIASNTADAGAHLGLAFWNHPSGLGRLAYADIAGYRVTAGLPQCPSDRLSEFFADFAAESESRNLRRVHFGLPGAALEFLDDRAAPARVHRVHLGALPLFDLETWRAPSSIRAQVRRARNHGVAVRHLAAPPAPGSTDAEALSACRDAWLRRKPLPPLGFMTTPFLFSPWPASGVLVAEREGNVEGFLTMSRALFGDVVRVDAVARRPGAPNGCAELLIVEAFRRAAEHGARRATLGLAPLSRRAHATEGRGPHLPGFLRTLASPLYSFAGLEMFKAKFTPTAWVPLYAVAAGPRFTARDVLAVARTFAGGSLTRYAAQTAAWMLGIRPVSR